MADTQPKTSWWSGRKRRNSESSLASLKEFVTGRRNSISGTPTEANVLRKKPPQAPAPAQKSRSPAGSKPDGKASAADPDAGKNNEKQQSR